MKFLILLVCLLAVVCAYGRKEGSDISLQERAVTNAVMDAAYDLESKQIASSSFPNSSSP